MFTTTQSRLHTPDHQRPEVGLIYFLLLHRFEQRSNGKGEGGGGGGGAAVGCLMVWREEKISFAGTSRLTEYCSVYTCSSSESHPALLLLLLPVDNKENKNKKKNILL